VSGRRMKRGPMFQIGTSVAVAILVIGVAVLVRVAGGSTGGGKVNAAQDGASKQSAAGASPTARAPASVKPGASPKKKSASPTASAAHRPAAPAKVVARGHRTVTFVNRLSQTLWVASGEQTPKPALPVSGWVLKPGQSKTIKVPDLWNGRFWGRTGCSFNSKGIGHCQTGDCAGRFQCHQYGGIPATLAEFKFNTWMNLDFYDVSLVDGSNVPMYINIAAGKTKDPVSAGGCSPRGCTHPVVCPAALQIHAGGKVVGCLSPCAMLKTDQYCCRGNWSGRANCKPDKWPVKYAAVFKKAQPFAYSYVYDDATSTFTCAGECGYQITFGLSP
jgi:hypothetical protein